jgi:hypothetical protein
VVDRKFWVNEGRKAEFEEVFGPDGVWREFLSRSSGYAGSELRCESPDQRQFRLKDFWKSHLEFESFRDKFAADYEQLTQRVALDRIVERQELVGMYYTDENERGEEEGLVSA